MKRLYLLAVCLAAAVLFGCGAADVPAGTAEQDAASRTSAPAPVTQEPVPTEEQTDAPAVPGTEPPETETGVPGAPTEPAVTEEETQPPAPPENPETQGGEETIPPAEPEVPLGLYVWMNSGNKRVFTRVTDFRSRWPENDADYQGQWAAGHWTKDTWNFPGETHLICDTKYFFVLPSDAETVTFRNPCWTAAWSAEWQQMWTEAGLGDKKIGYAIQTELKDGRSLWQTVLGPDGTVFEMAPYYEVYLYDEVNRPDGDHVTAALVTDRTVYTDIKITLRNGCYDVQRFTLTAFVYSGTEDFDLQGNYCGALTAQCFVSADNYR